jgi:flavodoxin
MSTAYKIGRLIGSNPKLQLLLIFFAIVVFITNCSGDEKPKADNGREADNQVNIAKAEYSIEKRQALLLAICTDGIDKLKQDAADFMKKGSPGSAVSILGVCEGLMTDSQAKALLADSKAGVEAEERKLQKEQAVKQAKLDAAEKARKKREGVSLGMTMQDVLDSSWGKPRQVIRTQSPFVTTEVWIYSGGTLAFNNGVLSVIQN